MRVGPCIMLIWVKEYILYVLKNKGKNSVLNFNDISCGEKYSDNEINVIFGSVCCRMHLLNGYTCSLLIERHVSSKFTRF